MNLILREKYKKGNVYVRWICSEFMITINEWTLCLAHSDRGCVIYSGLDLNSGEIYAITEWKVNTKDHCYNLKQVHSSEQEFTYLSKLKNYNLVRYLAMKYVHVKEEIIIYILQEFVLGNYFNLGIHEFLRKLGWTYLLLNYS